MPNVVDIIHKLTYDANTDPIKQVNAAFGEQQKEVELLYKRYNALTAQQERAGQQGIKTSKLLTQQIELTRKKIDETTAAMGKQYAQSERLQTAVKRTAGQFDSLSFSLGNVLRDLPYGFIGIANNIGPAFDDIQRKFKMLQAEGKGTGALFSSIGASLFGFTGIVNLVITGIQLLSSQLGGITEATADLTNAQEANIVVNKEAAKLYAKEAAELGLLADEVADTATSQERLQQIRTQLIKDYPALAKSLEGEENLNTRLFNAIINVTEALKQQAIVKASLNLITKETERYLAGEIGAFNAFGAGIRASAKTLLQGTGAFLAAAGEEAGKQNQNQYDATIKNLTNILKNAQQQLNQSGLFKIITPDEETKGKIKDTQKTLKELKIDIDALARSINRLDSADLGKFGEELEKAAQKANKELDLLLKNFTKLEQSQFGSKLTIQQSSELNRQLTEQQQKRADLDNKKRQNDIIQAQKETSATQARIQMESYRKIYKEQRELDPNSDKTKAAREDFKNARQKYRELRYIANEETRATIDAAAQGYQQLASTVGDILNQIYDRQLETLDRQISATQERISLAVELAKAGNASILQEESNRLDELQKKREEIAEKQVRTNAILRASSAAIAAAQAIQTVTNAGATGDPYTTAARIAAAIAALTAGISFVTSLTEAFAEGVVDYKGKGTSKSDSNMVRISRGESVITAEATQKHRDILEAMNAGTFDPNRLTPIQAPATSISMKGLEKRMDEMIDVVSRSHTTVHASMTPDGLRLATERATRIDKNRFRH